MYGKNSITYWGNKESYCHQKRNEITSKIRLGEDLSHVAIKKET